MSQVRALSRLSPPPDSTIRLCRPAARSYVPAAVEHEAAPQDIISDAYARATRINARLASRYDANLVSEGRELAQKLLDHVRAEASDYDDFVRRVARSEVFSLHDSAQVTKNERQLKVLYVRATDLLETIEDAERRRRR